MTYMPRTIRDYVLQRRAQAAAQGVEPTYYFANTDIPAEPESGIPGIKDSGFTPPATERKPLPLKDLAFNRGGGQVKGGSGEVSGLKESDVYRVPQNVVEPWGETPEVKSRRVKTERAAKTTSLPKKAPETNQMPEPTEEMLRNRNKYAYANMLIEKYGINPAVSDEEIKQEVDAITWQNHEQWAREAFPHVTTKYDLYGLSEEDQAKWNQIYQLRRRAMFDRYDNKRKLDKQKMDDLMKMFDDRQSAVMSKDEMPGNIASEYAKLNADLQNIAFVRVPSDLEESKKYKTNKDRYELIETRTNDTGEKFDVFRDKTKGQLIEWQLANLERKAKKYGFDGEQLAKEAEKQRPADAPVYSDGTAIPGTKYDAQSGEFLWYDPSTKRFIPIAKMQNGGWAAIDKSGRPHKIPRDLQRVEGQAQTQQVAQTAEPAPEPEPEAQTQQVAQTAEPAFEPEPEAGTGKKSKIEDRTMQPVISGKKLPKTIAELDRLLPKREQYQAGPHISTVPHDYEIRVPLLSTGLEKVQEKASKTQSEKYKKFGEGELEKTIRQNTGIKDLRTLQETAAKLNLIYKDILSEQQIIDLVKTGKLLSGEKNAS